MKTSTMDKLIKSLALRLTKHFRNRMIERGVLNSHVVGCFNNHKILPGKNPETVRLVGKQITVVITKSREVLTTYFNNKPYSN